MHRLKSTVRSFHRKTSFVIGNYYSTICGSVRSQCSFYTVCIKTLGSQGKMSIPRPKVVVEGSGRGGGRLCLGPDLDPAGGGWGSGCGGV